MITFKAKTASGEIINSALTPFFFPAGEAHIKQEPQRLVEPVEIAIMQPDPESLHNDLFTLAMWNDYLSGGTAKKVLVMPYAPGARADRGGPFGAEVYGEFISNLLLDQIIIFDPHSPIIVDKLKYQQGGDVTVVYSDELFDGRHAALFSFDQYAGVIAPDKGAVERAQAVADRIGAPLYKAEKKRDESTGQLSGFSVEDLPEEGKLLLVDDICDAGGTFLGLADASGVPKERLDLFVSHGVFSRNAETTLPDKYLTIYTTNSYNPNRRIGEGNMRTHGQFIRFDVIRLLLTKIKF